MTERKLSYITSKESRKGLLLDLPAFNSLLDSSVVADICKKIAATENDDEKQKLKGRLPLVQWMCLWNDDGVRPTNKTARPSGLCMHDFDHLTESAESIFLSRISGREEELGIALVHQTPRGGLRVISLLPSGWKVEQCQLWMAKMLGLEEFRDQCIKDICRCSFITCRDYLLFLDEVRLFAEDNFEVDVDPPMENVAINPTNEDGAQAKSIYPDRYHGIPYTMIVEKLIDYFGGVPEVGERNNRLHKVAWWLRYICDFQPAFVASLLPNYGLSSDEIYQLSKSACEAQKRLNIPTEMETIISMCEQEISAQNYEQSEGGSYYLDPDSYLSKAAKLPLPKQLPPIFAPYVNSAPEGFKQAMIMALLPILGTLGTGVRARYRDKRMHSLSFHTVVIGRAAGGKSFTRELVDTLLKPIKDEDKRQRELLNQYEKDLRIHKNDKKQPEEPDVCIRYLPPTISNTMLLERLDKAKGKHCFTFAEEIDTVAKSNASGAWSQKTDCYRLAFDNAEWGQEYKSDMSYSATVNVYYNQLFCGTPGSVQNFYVNTDTRRKSNNVQNGLCSRVIFVQLPELFATDIPPFKELTAKQLDEIDKAVNQLMSAEGEVTCPKLQKSIMEWVNEKRLMALQTGLYSIDDLRKRSAVIGFRAGVLAFVLNKYKENRMVNNFAQWVAEFVLLNQLDLLGSYIDQSSTESNSMKQKIKSLYNSLPAEFTKRDLIRARIDMGQSSRIDMVVSRWLSEGLIEQLDVETFRKKMKTMIFAS